MCPETLFALEDLAMGAVDAAPRLRSFVLTPQSLNPSITDVKFGHSVYILVSAIQYVQLDAAKSRDVVGRTYKA